MKTYTFTKEELDYLMPLESVRAALDNQIRFFILNRVYPRLGFKAGQKSTYNIPDGTIVIEDELAKEPKQTAHGHTK